MDTLLVLTNTPDLTTAKDLARTLVERRLAACVNILPNVQSIYRWQGEIESADEIPLLIKTTTERYPALEAAIRETHPYAVPEIIALPISKGLPAYLRWVIESTEPEAPHFA
ncbi:MAG: divalent-cation tolerance protein CutA [Burkholderiaceae bacterium]|nr:MAG: divalent-cation tolerance protein CutA [Burkholderiaceae bacterium]